MTGPSQPLLQHLRALIGDRGLSTGELAERSGISAPHLLAALSGISPMTVDELLLITQALELDPTDLVQLDGGDADLYDLPLGDAPSLDEPALADALDPSGNHIMQLFEVGFGLGCDFFFHADGSQLGESGLPRSVEERYRSTVLPIKLDAAFHVYNEPRYSPEGIHLKLSFDDVYDCFFPWSSVQRVIFTPLPPPEPDQPEPHDDPSTPSAPFLRLVE